MADHRPLGLPGGAGRVDDVGEVVEGGLRPRRLDGDRRHGPPAASTGMTVAVVPCTRSVSRSCVRTMGASVSASMKAMRSAGYSGSMGTYAAPDLQDGVERDDHLEGALHAHRDERVRGGPELDQPPWPAAPRGHRAPVGQGLVAGSEGPAPRGVLAACASKASWRSSAGYVRSVAFHSAGGSPWRRERSGVTGTSGRAMPHPCVTARRVPPARPAHRTIAERWLTVRLRPAVGASVPRNSGMSRFSPCRMPSRDSTAPTVRRRIERSMRSRGGRRTRRPGRTSAPT